MTSPNLEKLAKLLNQAENASTPEEADTFLQAAQNYATKYSLDLAKARLTTEQKQRTVPIQKSLWVGEKGQKGLATLIELIGGIATANDLIYDIYNNSTGIIVYGYEEDVQITEALYASLLLQMIEASQAYIKTGEYKNDTVWRDGYVKYVDENGKACSKADSWDEIWVEGGYKPVSALTARLDFQQAFASRVRQRLFLAKHEAKEEILLQEHLQRVADESGALKEEFKIWYYLNYEIDLDSNQEQANYILNGMGSRDGKRFIEYLEGTEKEGPGTELVLASKTEEVHDFHRKHSQARGSYKGGYESRGTGGSAAGRRAGDNARLGASKSLPGARKQVH